MKVIKMTDFKPTDIHFPLSAVNAGMLAAGVIEGDASMMALNGGLLTLNGGIAVGGRRNEIKESLSEAPEKALGSVYDSAVKNKLKGRISDVETDPGSRMSGRGIC